jgi:hypothetical protein
MMETIKAWAAVSGELLDLFMDPRWLLIFVFMGVGRALKAVPSWICPNWCIPFVLLLAGAAIGPWTVQPTTNGILFGAACGISSSWLYDNLFRPFSKWLASKTPWAEQERHEEDYDAYDRT